MCFTTSCAIVLLITCGCKLYTFATGYDHFAMADPLLGSLASRDVILVAAVIELLVSLTLLGSRNYLLKAGLIAWLSTIFLSYRIGLWWIGYKAYCTCLGKALSWLTVVELWHVDLVLKLVLGYMLFFGYYYFITGWAARNRCLSDK